MIGRGKRNLVRCGRENTATCSPRASLVSSYGLASPSREIVVVLDPTGSIAGGKYSGQVKAARGDILHIHCENFLPRGS